MMTTADLAALRSGVREDRAPLPPDLKAFADAFAWFKLTHRDMGPPALHRAARAEGRTDLAGPGAGRLTSARGRGRRHRAQGEDARLRALDRAARRTAWASASTFRAATSAAAPTARGPSRAAEGLGGEPAAELAMLAVLRRSAQFDASAAGGKKISLADPDRARRLRRGRGGGEEGVHTVTVPISHTDATPEQTDVEAVRRAGARRRRFRNYCRAGLEEHGGRDARGQGAAVA